MIIFWVEEQLNIELFPIYRQCGDYMSAWHVKEDIVYTVKVITSSLSNFMKIEWNRM